MCLSESSAGCRAVSKVTSTNCWHGKSSQQQKQGGTCAAVQGKAAPTYFCRKGRHKVALSYLWPFEKHTAPMDFSPSSLRYCNSECSWTINKIAIGFVERHSTAAPGRALTSRSTAPEAAGTDEAGQQKQGSTCWCFWWKKEGTPWALSWGLITTLNPAFCARIKRETRSSNQNSMNKSYKAQIMEKKQ